MSPDRKTNTQTIKLTFERIDRTPQQEDLPQKGDPLRKMPPNRNTNTPTGNQISNRKACPGKESC